MRYGEHSVTCDPIEFSLYRVRRSTALRDTDLREKDAHDFADVNNCGVFNRKISKAADM